MVSGRLACSGRISASGPRRRRPRDGTRAAGAAAWLLIQDRSTDRAARHWQEFVPGRGRGGPEPALADCVLGRDDAVVGFHERRDLSASSRGRFKRTTGEASLALGRLCGGKLSDCAVSKDSLSTDACDLSTLSGIAGGWSGHPIRTRFVLADGAGTALALALVAGGGSVCSVERLQRLVGASRFWSAGAAVDRSETAGIPALRRDLRPF